MVPADASQVIRVTIDGDSDGAETSHFTEAPVRIPQVLGTNIGGLTEVMSR
jgi:hypothetical protein